MSAILSIQSHVSYGHVGNSAAVFPLQRLGFEVWPVHTVLFSNHTGYGAWQGEVVRPDLVAAIVQGIEERGRLGECGAVLTGYLGDAALGAVVLDTVAKVRALNPQAIWVCDPVMGDTGRGLFVREGIPDFFRDKALPATDILTPNRFELEVLTGQTVQTLADALTAARALIAKGPRIVLVTSLDRQDREPNTIEMLAVSAEEAWLIATPEVPMQIVANGSGDATAALFAAHWLRTAGDLKRTLEHAAEGIFAIFEATHAAGTRELALIAAQDRLVDPARRFHAKPVD